MSEWNIVKLGSLANFKNGLNFSKDNWGKGLKVIGVSDFKDYLYPKYDTLDEINPDGVVKNDDYLKEGDILFVRSNGNRLLIGRSLYIKNLNEKVSHSGFTIRLRFTSSDVYTPFYVYIFKSSLIRSVLSLHGGGTNINNLNQEILSQLDVPLPPLSTQKKIAAILSAYDDLIENNRHRIALLEKMAEEIYREWFVRLRFPGYEQAKFHKGVPEGWEIAQLGNVVKDIIDYRGVTPKKLNSDWQSEGIIALSALNVKKGKLIRLEDAKRVSEPLFERWMKKKLDRLDILLTSEAPLGEVYILMEKEKYVLSQRLFAIRANPKKIEPVYLYYYLLCEAGQYELSSKATGSTVGGIRQALLRKVEILNPTYTIQKKFSTIAQPILEEIHKLWKKNNLLRQTRERLLTRLISGKLSIDDLDIQYPPKMAEERLS